MRVTEYHAYEYQESNKTTKHGDRVVYRSAKERDPSLLACRSVPSRLQTSASTTRKQESNVYTTIQQTGSRGFLQWARFACMAERSEKDPSCKSTKQNFILFSACLRKLIATLIYPGACIRPILQLARITDSQAAQAQRRRKKPCARSRDTTTGARAHPFYIICTYVHVRTSGQAPSWSAGGNTCPQIGK